MSPGHTKILHLSDIHFGRINEAVLVELKSFISELKSDLHLVIVTGDLTQRAKKNEFLNARAFLESFNCPVVAVPGNHDVPLYNIFLRFFAPYLKFCQYLAPFSKNYYESERVIVYGLWSANNFTIKDGRITEKELIDLENKFRNVDSNKIRIIASHHSPFSVQEPMKGNTQRVLEAQPHLILSGHEHQSGVTQLPSRKFPLLVSSGTSASNRTRVEANSFNIITIAPHGAIVVETFTWEENIFKLTNRFDG